MISESMKEILVKFCAPFEVEIFETSWKPQHMNVRLSFSCDQDFSNGTAKENQDFLCSKIGAAFFKSNYSAIDREHHKEELDQLEVKIKELDKKNKELQRFKDFYDLYKGLKVLL